MDRPGTGSQHLPYAIWILFAALLLFFVIGGAFFYRTQERHLRTDEEQKLLAIAQLKVNEITRWRLERQGDASVALAGPFFSAAVKRWLAEPDPVLAAQITERLESYRRGYRYASAFIVDATAHVRLSAGKAEEHVGPETAAYLEIALREKRPLLSELYRCSVHHAVHLDIIAPLISDTATGRTAVAALILRIDPNEFLYPLIQLWPEQSASAETLLVGQDGDEVVFLNELRHKKGTALNLRIPLSQLEVPAVRAVRGEEGVFEGLDYRGVPVLSALKHVPDSSWFMVAKIDTAEAFAAWHFQATIIIVGTFLFLSLIFAGIGFFWYRQQGHHYRELYQAEKTQKESEEKFRHVFEHSHIGISLTAVDGTVNINRKFLDMLGYTKEEFGRKKWQEITHPDDIAGTSTLVAALLSGEKNEGRFTKRYIHKNGSVVWTDVVTVLLRDENGESLYFITAVMDITDRKRQEETLRQSEEKFRAMAETIPLAIYLTTGIEQKCEYLNPMFVKLFGYTLDIIPTVAQWWPLAYPDEEYRRQISEEWARKVARAIETQTAIEPMEVVVTCKDGAKKNILWGYMTLGEKNYAYGLDLTERKALESAREELMASLQDKNEEMESILYASSHDLRSPLVNIQGFSARIQRYLDELNRILAMKTEAEERCETITPIIQDKIPKALSYVIAGTDKMDALVNGLLKLSRLGRATHTPEVIDMNGLIRETLDALKFQTQEAAAMVTVVNLPPCWGDRHEIGQAFSNLVDNALKYRDPARPLAIRITGTAMGDRVAYSVEDTGIGIKKGHQDQIWNLFSRLDPGGPVPGEGIGLTMVKRIIQRNRGRIWMESEPGKGSSFYIVLPHDRTAAGKTDTTAHT